MGHISVPEYEEIARVFCTLAEECTSAMRVFHDEIESNCRRCKYKPMVDFTNRVCRFFYGDFRYHLMGAFAQWEESSYSLDNLARNIRAGEDAAAVGKRYMMQIRDSLEGLFAGSRMEEVHIDVSMPEIDEEMILRNQDYIRHFLRTAEGATDLAVRTIETRAADNDAFYCLIGYVRTMGKSMINSFQDMLAQVENGAELYGGSESKVIGESSAETGRSLDVGGSLNWPFDSPFM